MKISRKLLLLFSTCILSLGIPSMTAGAQWVNTANGRMYTQTDSPGYVVGLAKIGDQTYYFNEQGIMQTGFQKIGEETYYFNALGQLQLGRFVAANGKTYYGDPVTGALAVNKWVENRYYQADGSMAVNTWINTKYVGATGLYTKTQKRTGWVTQGGQKYYYNKKGVAVKGKKRIDGNLYYFDPSTGAMKTGWFTIGKSYYYAKSNGVLAVNEWQNGKYLKSSGAAATGWYEIDGASYLFTSSGDLCDGWIKYKNKKYYCVKGVVQKNAWVEDGKYYVLASGARATGWQRIEGYIYYFNPSSGVKKVGRVKVGTLLYFFDSYGRLFKGGWADSGRYYASAGGALLTGLQNINDSLYYFNTSGRKVENKLKTVGGSTYFFMKDGVAAKNMWVKIGSDFYFFQRNGKMAKNKWVGEHYVDMNGVMTNQTRRIGWQTIDGKKYYYTNKGALVTGWKEISGSKYYFEKDTGVMLTGIQMINNKKYYFYADGRMASSISIAVGMKEYTINSDGIITAEKSIKVSGNSTGTKIVNYALQYVGNPYVWGGTSLTNGADCSGFVQTVFAHFGIKLLRVADDQMKGPNSSISSEYKRPTVVDSSSMLPGDLIFYGASTYATHVAIYMGNGQIVHASNSQPYPQGGIKISDYDYQTPVRVMRYWS